MITCIIPCRNELYLHKTVSDLIEKADTELQIIIVYDGPGQATQCVLSDEQLVEARRVADVIEITTPAVIGMRGCLNMAASRADGKYLLKTDAHCMFAKSYNSRLLYDIEDIENAVIIPRRLRLDAESWSITEIEKGPVDYEYLTCPLIGDGLHGKIWKDRTFSRAHNPIFNIDDNMSFQGSCWFMKKEYYNFLELLDDKTYGPFWQEAQEIGFKAWLSGGKVLVDKNTWYAHLHKKSRGYSLSSSWKSPAIEAVLDWTKKKMWHKQIYPFSHLIDIFYPVPTWPNNYKEMIY